MARTGFALIYDGIKPHLGWTIPAGVTWIRLREEREILVEMQTMGAQIPA